MEKDLDDSNPTNEKSIKLSPNYDQQIEEIELLKNIIPEKIKILKEEPNFNIQLEIEANNIEEPIKKFILIIYLNYNYPEQSPEFKINEINNNISDNGETNIKNQLAEYCAENIGFPVIYQLYEICQEFANIEEKINPISKEKDINLYQLNKLNQIKIIHEFPIDMILLKNGNILIVNSENKIKIYDNTFESILLETLRSDSFDPIVFCKYFPSNTKNERDYLYLFTFKDVLIYEICYLSKKKILSEKDIIMNGNIQLNYIDKINSMSDVIEFSQFKNCAFFVSNEDGSHLLHKYIKNKKIFKFENKIIKNKTQKIFRKLYKINSKKFIISSYTLKVKVDEYKIEGINKMFFIDSNNFKILKSYNIKLSPLNKAISNYKDKYIIVSYFNCKSNENQKKKKKKEEDELYNFEGNDFNMIYHSIANEINAEILKQENNYYYYDDYDDYEDFDEDKYIREYYHKFNNKYYSFDIREHFIGIFNVNTDELVSIYEFDPIKIIYNINDNLLCLFEKYEPKNIKTQQIINEIMFHNYFSEIPIREDYINQNYIREKYICFASFDEGLKLYQENFNYYNITSFIEINKSILAIGSKKKGIILYNSE